MNLEEAKKAIARKAIRMQVGGFRPPDDPKASWFGKVNFALPGETWPTTDGKPMHALCQINLTEMPFRPPGLEDMDFIAVFIGPDDYPDYTKINPSGDNWVLRVYKDINPLVPLPLVETQPKFKSFPMKPEIVEMDFPCHDDFGEFEEDIVDVIEEDLDDEYYEECKTSNGLKLGGWPSLIQHEAFYQSNSAEPQYVFQIDSEEKAGWHWGDGGCAYIGRGTADGHKDDWFLAWQMY